MSEEYHQEGHRVYSMPYELFTAPGLSLKDKIAINQIDRLDNDERHCYASNGYLAERLEMEVGSVVNMLTRLRKKGWVIDVPNQDNQRRLTTPLGENRRKLKRFAVANKDVYPVHSSMEEPPSQDGYPVHSSMVPLYKDLSLEEKREEQLLEIFRKYLPTFLPSPMQQGEIFDTVTDVALWEECCKYWALNTHQPRSVGRLLDMYSRKFNEKTTPSLSNTRVVIDDFNSGYCASCENGFKHLCPEHREDK